jgi:hypothetical protein
MYISVQREYRAGRLGTAGMDLFRRDVGRYRTGILRRRLLFTNIIAQHLIGWYIVRVRIVFIMVKRFTY